MSSPLRRNLGCIQDTTDQEEVWGALEVLGQLGAAVLQAASTHPERSIPLRRPHLPTIPPLNYPIGAALAPKVDRHLPAHGDETRRIALASLSTARFAYAKLSRVLTTNSASSAPATKSAVSTRPLRNPACVCLPSNPSTPAQKTTKTPFQACLGTRSSGVRCFLHRQGLLARALRSRY